MRTARPGAGLHARASSVKPASASTESAATTPALADVPSVHPPPRAAPAPRSGPVPSIHAPPPASRIRRVPVSTRALASCGTNGRCDGQSGCQRYPNGTTCRPPRCETGPNAETGPSVCMGGTCRTPAPIGCAPFRGCTGTRCITQCGSDAQCAAGFFCINGTCGKRPTGGLCSRGADCVSTICAQGRCCATACDSPCVACNVAGNLGTCSPVAAGTEHPGCGDARCSGCNGMGQCTRSAGVACGAPSCGTGANLNAVVTPTCTALGACVPVPAACPQDNQCWTAAASRRSSRPASTATAAVRASVPGRDARESWREPPRPTRRSRWRWRAHGIARASEARPDRCTTSRSLRTLCTASRLAAESRLSPSGAERHLTRRPAYRGGHRSHDDGVQHPDRVLTGQHHDWPSLVGRVKLVHPDLAPLYSPGHEP